MDKRPFIQGSMAQIKKKQLIYLMGVVVVILVVVWGIFFLLSDNGSPDAQHHEKSTLIPMTDPLTHVNESSIWVERTQNTLAKAMKTTESLQQQLQMLNQSKAAQEKSTQAQSEQVQALQNQLNNLEQRLSNSDAKNNTANATPFPPNVNADGVVPHGVNGMSEDILTLSPYQRVMPATPPIPSRTPDTYVPAGTFVRAVMIGGADASAGVNSQGNPTPMLFRVLDQGTLPNHHKSHLKDCTATAAVIGDISSERGQIRLERLSCVAPNDEIVDTPVEGTVFGPEGKNGVRGIPLWREGALLKRAFVAGTLSGLSSGISQQYTTTAISPLGGASSSVNDGAIFKYGAATGVAGAMDKMADYNMRRADQYHPVIQLSAGTVVDLVFLKGFFLDGEKHDDPKKESVLPPFGMSTAVPTTLPSVTEQPSTLPLTQRQIDTLKTKTLTESGL